MITPKHWHRKSNNSIIRFTNNLTAVVISETRVDDRIITVTRVSSSFMESDTIDGDGRYAKALEKANAIADQNDGWVAPAY